MRDKTYLLFQRCYLVTLGIVISSLVAVFVLIHVFVTVNTIIHWQLAFAVLAGVFAAILAGIGIFGKTKQVIAWTDPLKTGELFEFLVIGIACPLFSLVWIARKVFVRE